MSCHSLDQDVMVLSCLLGWPKRAVQKFGCTRPLMDHVLFSPAVLEC